MQIQNIPLIQNNKQEGKPIQRELEVLRLKLITLWCVVILCCIDDIPQFTMIYNSGTNFNVNRVPYVTSVGLPVSVWCISGLDSNEEQGVGRGSSCLSCVDMQAGSVMSICVMKTGTHTHTFSYVGRVILFIMQSDTAGGGISHKR